MIDSEKFLYRIRGSTDPELECYFFMKHSRPDVANATGQLSKANDGANPAAFKELLPVIRHVLDTNEP